ncbi:MAG: cation:proton antiporter subunit C [Hyphomonadaceae bacterium]|nr:cation:proton antiporter subunit C [Hyphomonadaceae bacterium]
MLEFILARGNYWVIVALMMTGLYISFSAQNLIKRLVGLSVFQTSVFLFYITLGKVAGGTAPILIGEDLAGHHGGGHGEVHEDEAHGASEAAHGAVAEPHDVPEADHAPADEILPHDETEALHGAGEAVEGAPPLEGEDASLLGENLEDGVTETSDYVLSGPDLGDALHSAESSLHTVYSNPLPHVLILTAIVVGVATLAVGLAIIVRIREAYGTIEADEVRAIDIDVALEEEAEEEAAEAAA